MNLTELEKKIINYDKLYREGNSPITDFEFDKLKNQNHLFLAEYHLKK